MYRVIEKGIIKFKHGEQTKVAEKLGIDPTSLNRILSGRANTQYTTAYCIVKLYDSEKEVLDFFRKID